MNRYIVIDLEKYIIYDTHDLKNIIESNFDRYGSTVFCGDMQNVITELEEIAKELKEMNKNDK